MPSGDVQARYDMMVQELLQEIMDLELEIEELEEKLDPIRL